MGPAILVLLGLALVASGPAAFFMALALRRRLAILEVQVGALRAGSSRRESTIAPRAPAAPTLAAEPAAHPRAASIVPSRRTSQPVAARRGDGLETLIGTRWLNRVGVVTLLVGAALFLKLSYDNGWVGPTGRTLATAAAGVAAIGFGEWTRKRGYGVVADGVTAFGFGALYAAGYFAYAFYGLIGDRAAFAVMALTTAAGVAFSVWRSSQPLGFLSFLGGYLTPVLLSTHEDRLPELLAYLLVLGAGAEAVAALRPWISVRGLSFVGSWALFGAAYVSFHAGRPDEAPLIGAGLLFALHIARPFGAALLGRAGDRRAGAALVALDALVATLFYRDMLASAHPAALVLAVLGIGAVLAALAAIAWRRSGGGDPIARSALLAALASATYAIDVRFGLSGGAVLWTVEAVALVLIGRRVRSAPAEAMGAIALALAMIGTLADERAPLGAFRPVLNSRFLGGLEVAAGCLAVSRIYHRAIASRSDGIEGASRAAYVLSLAAAGIVLAAIGAREAFEGVRALGLPASAANPWLWTIAASVPALFVVPAVRDRSRPVAALAAAAYAVAVLAFASLAAGTPWRAWPRPVLNAEFLAALLLVSSLAAAGAAERRVWPKLGAIHLGAALVLFFCVTSLECFEAFRRIEAEGHRYQGALASLSILWALYASALLAAGLWRRYPPLRYAAIGLFGVTLAKVFLFDLSELEAHYRILAFVSLGLLLVAGSYLYARFVKRVESAAGAPSAE